MITKKGSLGLIFLGVFYTTIACGQAYKCRNANGQLIYSDSPCTVGSKTEKVILFTPSPAVTIVEDNSVARWKEIKKARSQREKIEQQKRMMQEQEELQQKTMQTQQQEIAPQQQQKEVMWQQPQEVRTQSAGSQQQLQESRQQQFQEAQNQHNKKVAQALQQQQREVAQARQEQQQAVMQAQQQQQQQQELKQQESQRLVRELEKQIPAVTQAMKNAGASGGAVRDAMIQNQINELNRTAKHGVQVQIQKK